ncbi:MAG: GDSL-type esterase/lipase family protein [Gemmatimonadota bacterium]|nr:GDSL-type esterase/lipase family protein [Gemmatimonadota bacterium]
MTFRVLSTLAVALTAACSQADTPARAEAPASPDSLMVVGSESQVPSDDRPVVVFLGTSLTAGLGLDREDDTYVARLEAMGSAAGLPFRAVNAGVSGETSAGGLRRVDWILREPADVLVVELGANDGLRGQDPEAMRINLTTVIQRARSRYPGLHVLLAGMEAPPNLGARYTTSFRAVFPELSRRISRGCQERGRSSDPLPSRRSCRRARTQPERPNPSDTGRT